MKIPAIQCLWCCLVLLFLGKTVLSDIILKIYVVSPDDDSFPFSIKKLKPATVMAIDYITRNKILPNYKLKFYYVNSKCEPTAAYTEFLREMQGDCQINNNDSIGFSTKQEKPFDRFSAIFGPICSYVLSGLSRMNWNIWRVPIITIGGFAQPFRDRYVQNRYINTEYKFITAVGYNYQDPAELIVSMCSKYKWKKLVFLSPLRVFDHSYDFMYCSLFSVALEAAINRFQSKGGELEMAKKKLNETLLTLSIRSVLTTEFKDYSIFVLCMDQESLRDMMLTAQQLKFDNGEYVFINVDLFNKAENLITPWKNLSSSIGRTVPPIYRSMFTVTLKPVSGEKFQNFSNDAKDIARRKYNFTYDSEKVSTFVAAHHDSIIHYANAVRRVLKEGLYDISNASAITIAMQNVSFEGSSGNHTITEFGDRYSEYNLLEMNTYNGNFRSVATYDGLSKTYSSEEDKIDWGNLNNQPPPDTPLCGYNNENCKTKNNLLYYVLLGIFLVLVAISVVVGVVVFRNVKFQAELKAMSWLIASDTLESLESRCRRISKKENLSVASISREEKRFKKKKPKISRSQNSSRELLFENLRINKYMYDKIAYPLANNHRDTDSYHSNLSIDSIAGVPFSNINNCKLYGCIAVYKGSIVAMKQIRSEKRIETTRELLLEVKKLKDLNYHHICRFIGACLDAIDQYIVYEYCCKGSLKDILAQNQLVLDWMFKYSLIQDICRGMIYIHNNIGVHGNLKSSKCVVDSRFVLKISGFGINLLSGRDKSHFPVMKDEKYYSSLLWTSPEVLRNNLHLSSLTIKSDVYSFAIICQEIIYRKGQFYIEEKENLSAKEKINQVKKVYQVPFRPTIYAIEGCTEEFVKIVTDAWNESPISRPDFTAIKGAMRKLNKSGDTGNILDNLLSRMEQYANNLEDLVAERTDQYLEEKRRAETLLYSMLPKSVAHQLIRKQNVIAESYEMVTVYFSDIVGFTSLSAESTPMEIVTLLNKLYTTFDSILEQFDVYKVETIGDAYVVCSGLPSPNENNHAREIGRMSIAFLNELFTFVIPHRPDRQLKLRIGIHSGPVCAGVVGLKMPRYCLFGDTVNTSSRMESSGLPLKIHMSSSTKHLLCTFNSFIMTERGYVEMKGKGLQLTYWLHGENGNIVDPINPGDIIISNFHVSS